MVDRRLTAAGRAAVAAAAAALFFATGASAFEELPKIGAKSLGVTRGGKFSSGAVFVNGQYLEPPYVVERWGTGIRINSRQVTGQIVSWNEFAKTQPGAKAVEIPAPEDVVQQTQSWMPPAASEPEPEDSLDDLFDDNPKPAKPAAKAPAPAPAPPAPPKPAVVYEFDGKFEKNAQAKALVNRINAVRTEIDAKLRSGGFIFFGDGYQRITGDAATAQGMLFKLSTLLQKSGDAATFRSGLRSSGMVYLNDIVAGQLFANRSQYPKLRERAEKIKRDREWSEMVNGAGGSLF